MAIEWYLNQYECGRCSNYWEDEWSCTCDDRCPGCDQTTSPLESVDLSRELKTEDYLVAAAGLGMHSGGFGDGTQIEEKATGAWIVGKIWIPAKLAAREVQKMLEKR